MPLQLNPEYGYTLHQFFADIMNNLDPMKVNKSPIRSNAILDLVFTTKPDLINDI